MIELQLPYPPSQNHLWAIRKGGMRLSDRYKSWLTEAGWVACSQKPGTITGPYKLSVHAVRPDRRQRDLDNLLKPISDLLQQIGVIRNDSDCEMLSARWVTTGEGITVRIEPAGVE